MQLSTSSSSSVRCKDWAKWLGSIAEDPRRHGVLVWVGSQIRYLTREDKERREKSGEILHVLTFYNMIQITQKIWNDSTENLSTLVQKRQILRGLEYIQEQRRMKYNRLFFLIKWIAILRGVGSQINAEKKSLESLKMERRVGEAPIFPRKIVKSAEELLKQLNSIRQLFTELVDRREYLGVSKIDDWYEEFFKCEKKLYRFKLSLSDNQFQIKHAIKDLEKEVEQWNGGMPRVKSLIKAFGVQSIKSSLRSTLACLCAEKKVTSRQRNRDKILFQCNELEVYALYAKRLIKAENTELSLSLVTAIERTWKTLSQTGQEATTKIIKGKCVIFAPRDQEIYLKEFFLVKGTYKAVFVISSFLSIKKVEDRFKLVILQPLNFAQEEIEEEQGFKIEAENCLKYSRFVGIWPTWKVMTIDGQWAILQKIAGYDVKTVSGKKVRARTLEDMAILFRGRELGLQDQLVYLKMIENFLMGVRSLHQEGIIHRDLKPRNILCSQNGLAGVSDLGAICASKIFKKKDDRTSVEIPNPQKEGMVGTPLYMSPEMVEYNKFGGQPWRWHEIDTATDMWSIGLILWECLSGQSLDRHHAFDGLQNNNSSLVLILRRGQLLSKRSFVCDFYYEEPKERTSLAQLIWWCTKTDPAKRPTILDVLDRYQKWVKFVIHQFQNNEIQFLDECFNHPI